MFATATLTPGRVNNRQSLQILGPLLLFTSVICQHLQVASLGGYPLTLGAITGILFLAITSRPLCWPLALGLASGITALTCAAALWDGIHAAPFHYMRTLALILGTVFIVLFSVRGLDADRCSASAIRGSLYWALCTISGLSMLQAIAGFFGNGFFFNPWRGLQYLYTYDPSLPGGTVPRVEAFFLEPSYNALTLTFLVAVLLRNQYRKWSTLIIGAVGIVAAQSATGLATLVLFLAAWGFSRKLNERIVGMVVLVAVLVLTSGYLASRLQSTTTSNSSANYRLLAPLPLLRDALLQAPLGRPLGSISEMTASYNLINGTTAGTTIDNGYMVIVFYFGWIGLALCLIYFLLLVWLTINGVKRQTGQAQVVIWLGASMMFNGGIFLPEFAFMTCIALIAYRQKGN